MAKIRRGRALILPSRAPLIAFTHCHPTRSTSMQTFAKLALAAGACALGLGAVLPAQAADMGYPEAQAAPGYPAPPPGYYAPPPAEQGYYPPPPPAAYGYPPPPVEYDTYVAPPYVVAPGPYGRGYGPHYAYGYGHWRGYRRW